MGDPTSPPGAERGAVPLSPRKLRAEYYGFVAGRERRRFELFADRGSCHPAAVASVSTHVLDAAVGGPRPGVRVTLETAEGTPLAIGITDATGRVEALAGDLQPGRYRLRWDLTERAGFLREAAVVIDLEEDRHYHVPLLAAPACAMSYLGA
jgi:5-hydroxyisourate hydrolase-like protein (transthyretin family)